MAGRRYLTTPLAVVLDESPVRKPDDPHPENQFAVVDHRVDDGVLLRYSYARDAAGVLVDRVEQLTCSRCGRHNHLTYAKGKALCRECDTDDARLLDAARLGDEAEARRLITARLPAVGQPASNELRSLLNARDSKGNTPLMLAAANGRGDVVKLLLPRGEQNALAINGLVSLTATNSKGQTARDLVRDGYLQPQATLVSALAAARAALESEKRRRLPANATAASVADAERKLGAAYIAVYDADNALVNAGGAGFDKQPYKRISS